MNNNPIDFISQRCSNIVKEREIVQALVINSPDNQADILSKLKVEHLTDPTLVELYNICHQMTVTQMEVNRHSVESMIAHWVKPQMQPLVRDTFQHVVNTQLEDTHDNTIAMLNEYYKSRVYYYDTLMKGFNNFMANMPADQMLAEAAESIVKVEIGKPRRDLRNVTRKVTEQILNPSEFGQGITTDLENFDRNCGGLKDDTLYVVGGFSSQGKTAWVVDLLYRLSTKHKDKVAICFFSLEMSEDRIVKRLISRHARITEKRMTEHGKPGYADLSDAHIQRIATASFEIEDWPIDIIHEPLTVQQMKIKARQFAMQHQGKQIIFILDHLTQMQRNPNEDLNSLSEKSIQGMKDIVTEHRCTGIALSQLKKEVIGPANRAKHCRPTLDHLYGSVAIITNADVIILLWRMEVYTKTLKLGDVENYPTAGKLMMIYEKNRDGQAPVDELINCEVQTNRFDNYTEPYIPLL